MTQKTSGYDVCIYVRKKSIYLSFKSFLAIWCRINNQVVHYWTLKIKLKIVEQFIQVFPMGLAIASPKDHLHFLYFLDKVPLCLLICRKKYCFTRIVKLLTVHSTTVCEETHISSNKRRPISSATYVQTRRAQSLRTIWWELFLVPSGS